MATVSFRITDELKRELDELSAEKGYHLSKLFRRAIEDLRDTMRHGPDGGAFDLSLKDRLILSNQYRILGSVSV
ncbi:ribbon-helix-helix domain-containing protein [uncultured Nisaea sp.]|uniref:ribbon-helix-helix domain-containing protein n=1 Tax=uncultured Nisaea sp. TaxID=538215 RepID=UPI0030ED24AC